MSARDIVATMWDRVEVVLAVDEASPPTTNELDAIAVSLTADNCGVKSVVRVVRVVERFELTAYTESGEPIYEDSWPSRARMRCGCHRA